MYTDGISEREVLAARIRDELEDATTEADGITGILGLAAEAAGSGVYLGEHELAVLAHALRGIESHAQRASDLLAALAG